MTAKMTNEENEADGIRIEVNRKHLKNQINKGLAGHKWRQKGPYLVCESCPVKHAIYIGTDKRLVGFKEDGEPIIKPFEARE
jgi:hypothetical protein